MQRFKLHVLRDVFGVRASEKKRK